MNADNAGDEGAQAEPDEPPVGDQHKQVAHEIEPARPETDLARQQTETTRMVAGVVQSPSPALGSALVATQMPGWRFAFESGARTQRFMRRHSPPSASALAALSTITRPTGQGSVSRETDATAHRE